MTFAILWFCFFSLKVFSNFLCYTFFDPSDFFFKTVQIFHVFLSFPVFLQFFLSSFVLLWLEKIVYMILLFFSLLGLASWTDTGSVLENVPHACREECILLLLGAVFCVRWYSSVSSRAKIVCILTELGSSSAIHFWKWGLQVPKYNSRTTFISPFKSVNVSCNLGFAFVYVHICNPLMSYPLNCLIKIFTWSTFCHWKMKKFIRLDILHSHNIPKVLYENLAPLYPVLLFCYYHKILSLYIVTINVDLK